ncbi:hypothetical protein [Pontibacter amylolyticus]|uniref:hypothetical protein n=1 Tax=Pontibacter amylolyticus TaxID=1424080 RepID=UPI001668B66D|nr:hypothetical protein [Pontibacter amylolyticus]
MNRDNYANIDGNVYLFTTKGQVYGKNRENVFSVNPKDITSFLYRNIDLMPTKIKTWLLLTLPTLNPAPELSEV